MNGRGEQHEVYFSARDGFLKIPDLPLTVSHGREYIPDMRVSPIGLFNGSDRVWARI
jgi:hypothetical protein